MNRKVALATAALVLSTFSGIAAAGDSLPTRAANALGTVILGTAIATQGNVALMQIRRELKESALEAMKPFLPDTPAPEQHQQPLAGTPVAQR